MDTPMTDPRDRVVSAARLEALENIVEAARVYINLYDSQARHEAFHNLEDALSEIDDPPADASERGDGWMPIETAPKDGTSILLCDASNYMWIAYSTFGEDGFEWHTNDECAWDMTPLYWRARPPAPGEKK